jgi:hypothetical protein
MELLVLYSTVFGVYLSTLAIQVGFALWRRELVYLYNMLVALNPVKQLKDGVPPSGSGRERRLQLLQKGMAVTFLCGCVPCFLTVEFLHARAIHINFTYSFLHAAITLLNISCCYILSGYNFIVVYLYFRIISDNLHEQKHRFNGITRYKTVSIVSTIFNQSYSIGAAPPVKYMGSFTVMTSLVGAIRLPSTSAASIPIRIGLVLLGLYYMGFMIMGVNLACSVWAKSNEYISKYRQCKGKKVESVKCRKYIRQVADSFGPIRFGVGGMYYMERNAKLTFLDFLFNGTLTTLIIFK